MRSSTGKRMKTRRWSKRFMGRTGRTGDEGLLETLWGIRHEHEFVLGGRLEAYLDHYRNLVLQVSVLNAFHDHRHVIELVQTIRNQCSAPVNQILTAIQQASQDWTGTPFSHEEALQALQFATRLWLFSSPELVNLEQSLDTTNRSLYENIRQPAATATQDYLSLDFSAKALTRKGGFYLVWTGDLAEHLTFASKDQLRVFRHAHILQQYQQASAEHTLYPAGFLAETHRTIHLLFPFEDYATSKRVRRLGRRERVDIEAAAATTTAEKAMEEHEKFQLASYPFYRTRLAEIQRRYDIARPRRLAQWWYDRRQRPEWAALIIALVVFFLTVLFGIAQTVTGVLQVVASWHT